MKFGINFCNKLDPKLTKVITEVEKSSSLIATHFSKHFQIQTKNSFSAKSQLDQVGQYLTELSSKQNRNLES